MAENDILLREVDDAVRHDRLMGLWNQFKTPLIYASAALILVTAGTSLWDSYQQSRAEEAAVQLDTAQQLYTQKKYDEAAQAFEVLTHQTRGELADMAKLWRARALLADGKKKTALRVLQNIIIAPEGHDVFWRDVACLHIAGLSKSVPDTCNGASPSPLAPLLTQMHAAAVWHNGDAEKARSLLDGLVKDESIPADARARANAWEATIQAHGQKE